MRGRPTNNVVPGIGVPDCFVLMPIGLHPDAHGHDVDFDLIYRRALRPAIAAAGLHPLRDDELGAGGLVQARTFEALVRRDRKSVV